MITLHPVSSSALAAVAYDQTTRVLLVQFRNGSCYEYTAVPDSLVHSLLAAESKGLFLNRFIRGSFAFRRCSQTLI